MQKSINDNKEKQIGLDNGTDWKKYEYLINSFLGVFFNDEDSTCLIQMPWKLLNQKAWPFQNNEVLPTFA